MRSVFPVLVALGMSASAAPAQEWAEKLFIKDNVPHLTHDFGGVARGTWLFHAFPVTNIYAVPIQIASIRSSAGCMTVIAQRGNLAPHESTVINVCMDASRFTGQKTAAIFVSFGPNNSEARLQVSAYSRADIVCNPGAVQFRTVPRGQTPSQTVDVEYAGKLPWQITKVIVPAEAPFDATLKETRLGSYEVTVPLKADAAPGPFRENVLLETNDPEAARLPVLVEGTIQWPRGVWRLGEVAVGETRTRQIEMHGNQPFLVLGIEGPEGVRLENKPNTKATQCRR
jgi:Protein of unknown function (DUF1573)